MQRKRKTLNTCVEAAAEIVIPGGSLVLDKIINEKRAKFRVVCDDGKAKGKVKCFRGRWRNRGWNRSCSTEEPPTQEPPTTQPPKTTCSEAENFPEAFSTVNQDSSQKILGGHPVDADSFSWIARLYLSTTGPTWACGGSVIANRWVLSAAHCCVGNYYIEATFGDREGSIVDSNEYRLRAAEWFLHPGYIRNENLDVCLIKFNEDIIARDPDNKVGAACLPNVDKDVFVDETCTVAGWGTTSYGGQSSSTLLEVDVDIFSDAQCQQFYGNSVGEYDICAGKLYGGKDSCQGDSGGPLICFGDGDGLPYLIGVVSRGYECGLDDAPGIYTSTYATQDWIRETVLENGL